jgi:hypothetical protein
MNIKGLMGLAFTLVLAVGAVIASDAPKAWTALFAEESWYKQQAGNEAIFHGKLEAIGRAPMASTLMRTSLYKLGGRTIYTGAKKVPALDALVGSEVEIRGKAVDMELEGQNLKEIWPAAVRTAGAAEGH